MDSSLSKQAVDWREGRGLRAWELKREGWKQQEIADALGVSKGALSQWMKRGREGGVEGLKRRIATGAPSRLSEGQRAELPELLERGAPAHGFRLGDVWMCERVGEVIRRYYFGVGYHPAHVRFLAEGAGSRVQLLERLPGYARDLDPDEGVCKHPKCVELKNLCCCENIAELRTELRKAKEERLRHKVDVIVGCIRQPGFEV